MIMYLVTVAALITAFLLGMWWERRNWNGAK